jgi:ParB family chromosome partitioning protein
VVILGIELLRRRQLHPRRRHAPQRRRAVQILDLLPARAAHGEPFVEAASFGPWTRLKASEITSLVLAAVTGASNVVRASCAAAAASWVHPLLRFAGTASADAVELQEAAE